MRFIRGETPSVCNFRSDRPDIVRSDRSYLFDAKKSKDTKVLKFLSFVPSRVFCTFRVEERG